MGFAVTFGQRDGIDPYAPCPCLSGRKYGTAIGSRYGRYVSSVGPLTYARRFVEAGGRLEELQHSLGHSSIRTTETCYGHFTDDTAASMARLRIYGSAATEPTGGSKRSVSR